MSEVKEEQERLTSKLHYALTDSQCNKCGAQLEWKPDFTNINQPRYKASHCNDEYLITIDTVKVELVKQDKGQEEGEVSPANMIGENKGHEQQQPNAIKMAEMLKDKEEESLLKKINVGDGSNIKSEDR
jgi:hypothetical protein